MVRRLRALYTTVLLWCFLRLGRLVYDYSYMHSNNFGRTTAMHFATSERELNISVRSYIEWLDNKGEQ